MHDPAHVIGDFFENKVAQLFDLQRMDRPAAGIVPDLVAQDGSFYIEVKAAAYNNVGVVKIRQLDGFSDLARRRFYAFVYHNLRAGTIQRDYPTAEQLKLALKVRSLYLFPYSIVVAFAQNSPLQRHPREDYFAKMYERHASRIFDRDETMWSRLELDLGDYQMISPHEQAHIITREGYLQPELLASFHPEHL